MFFDKRLVAFGVALGGAHHHRGGDGGGVVALVGIQPISSIALLCFGDAGVHRQDQPRGLPF